MVRLVEDVIVRDTLKVQSEEEVRQAPLSRVSASKELNGGSIEHCRRTGYLLVTEENFHR